MAKQRRQTAEFNAVLAEGGMTFMMTDMRAHHFRREKIAHTALYSVSLQRIVIVGRPEAVAAGQDLIIDSSTTRGAGFEFDVREAFSQHV